MNPELLEARWRLGAITTEDLHEVASAVLDAGHDFPSVIELFSLTRDEGRSAEAIDADVREEATRILARSAE